MKSIALTKTDRAKKIGGFAWLVITKLAQGIAFVIKKINWNKVGFVFWRLVVLAIGVVIAIAKLIGSIIAGFAALAFSRADNNEENSQDTESLRYFTLFTDKMTTFAKHDQDN